MYVLLLFSPPFSAIDPWNNMDGSRKRNESEKQGKEGKAHIKDYLLYDFIFEKPKL